MTHPPCSSRRSLVLATGAALVSPCGLLSARHAAAQTRIVYEREEVAIAQEISSDPGHDLQAQIDHSALGRMPGAPAGPSVTAFWAAPREVWLRRPATGQELRTVWWQQGQLVPEAYRSLSLFLGDPRMEQRMRAAARSGANLPQDWHHAVWVAPVVLEILYALNAWLAFFGMSRPIQVTSAFRHPLTNAAIEGAARDSLHQRGAAVDVIVPGVPASKVAQFGAWMRGGGVGVYPERGFTHLDAGRVRSWRGR